ncbi:hypothetical protein [Nesterenkonia halobia]
MNALAVYGTSSELESVPVTTAEINEARTLDLVRLGFGANLFSLLYGALSVTRDFGNNVVGRVRLHAGGSGRLLASRAVVVAPGMLAFGLLGPAAAVLTAWIVLPSSGAEFAWSSKTTTVTAGIAVSTVFAGYLGQFVAWQTRKSLITVIGLVAWTTLLESYIITLAPTVGRMLPGGLGMAMMKDTGTTDEILSVSSGYVGYVLWLAALSVLALVRLRRTDLVA